MTANQHGVLHLQDYLRPTGVYGMTSQNEMGPCLVPQQVARTNSTERLIGSLDCAKKGGGIFSENVFVDLFFSRSTRLSAQRIWTAGCSQSALLVAGFCARLGA